MNTFQRLEKYCAAGIYGIYYSSLDAGLAPELASLGGLVFFDENNDGIQDPTEVGVEGVTVYLLDENGMIIDTLMTDVDGNYNFTGFKHYTR